MFGKLSSVDCGNAPASIPSDGGITGPGVLMSFICSSVLAILLSIWVVFVHRLDRPAIICRKFLNGFSDAQILQGIGIQVIGLVKMNSLVPYHFTTIWELSLMALTTHIVTLLALKHDFLRDMIIRWARQFLVLISFGLSLVYLAFVIRAESVGVTKSTIPVPCVWQVKGQPSSDVDPITYIGTPLVMVCIFALILLAICYLRSKQQKFYTAIQIVGLVFMSAVATLTAVRLVQGSEAFGHPPVEIQDQGETFTWTYAQLLSLIVLLQPVLTVIEVVRGEMTVAAPVEDKVAEEAPDEEAEVGTETPASE